MNPTTTKEVATISNLRRIREEAPMTIEELAALAGVSYNTIQELETGKRGARPSTVRALAAALKVEPKDLKIPAFGSLSRNADRRRHQP